MEGILERTPCIVCIFCHNFYGPFFIYIHYYSFVVLNVFRFVKSLLQIIQFHAMRA